MNYTLSITAMVAVLGLSGCAASLVYDRDRPARDCRDPQTHCLSYELPAAAPGPFSRVETGMPGGRLAESAGSVPQDQVKHG